MRYRIRYIKDERRYLAAANRVADNPDSLPVEGRAAHQKQPSQVVDSTGQEEGHIASPFDSTEPLVSEVTQTEKAPKIAFMTASPEPETAKTALCA